MSFESREVTPIKGEATVQPRILVVDDNEAVRTSLAEVLEISDLPSPQRPTSSKQYT